MPGGILSESLSLPTETQGTAKQTPGISGDDLHPNQTHVDVCACACVCIRGETAASINMPHSSDTDKNLGQGMNCQMGDQKGMKSTVHACYS